MKRFFDVVHDDTDPVDTFLDFVYCDYLIVGTSSYADLLGAMLIQKVQLCCGALAR